MFMRDRKNVDRSWIAAGLALAEQDHLKGFFEGELAIDQGRRRLIMEWPRKHTETHRNGVYAGNLVSVWFRVLPWL